MSARKSIDRMQWSETERWLSRADDDLRAAEALFKSELAGAAAFHCQQAVEKKSAKAVLIALAVPPPRIHDIEKLGALIAESDAEIAEDIKSLSSTTVWYISERYPDSNTDRPPSFQEIGSVLAILHVLRRKVAALAPTS